MKTITIIAEQMTDRMLIAATPNRGVVSVTVSEVHRGLRDAAEIRAFGNPNRFDPRYRIVMVVEDDAVETVFDCVAVAYEAGFFSDAEAWVESSTWALSA
ncbi:P-II family nitrogen regulator [Mycolicibacterium sp.]|uniref:P-II family nitrogen regulator n=1 Tax=Mycolicibacterium sp. TaxID=2320850 RepID=UPI0028A60C7E|nr:P-II family nitrogen regulator [Mycolicibacterium sp.]